MIRQVRLSQLQGLGDRWESEIRQQFGREAENFVPPDSFESELSRQLVKDIQRQVHRGQGSATALEKLQARAQNLGLQLTQIQTDRENFVLLDEIQPSKGWGKVLFRVGPTQPLVLEVPHPGFDARTPELGISLFEKSRAEVLLVAGAHRLNLAQPSPEQPDRQLSDPAHSTATFFHAAHQGLEGPGQTVFQIHGFAARSPQDPAAVVSDGLDDQHDPPALTSLHQQLGASGFEARLVDFKEDWLTARTNVQGQSMADKKLTGPEGPSQFIHLELEAQVRRDPEKFAQILDALSRWSQKLYPEKP